MEQHYLTNEQIAAFASSPSGNVAEKYPPAGGMGDWGLPQQARLSYKCYACVNAAIGGRDFQ